MLRFYLECCCQCADDARRAEAAGASRIELCEQLPLDGLTPSEENVRATLAAVTIPVNVLIRCRAGNFVYTADEVEQMARSIASLRRLSATAPDAREHRVNAVVIGALTSEGDVDHAAMATLLAAAEGLPVTFHRAFDVCRDPLQAYDDLARLGVSRILTSGCAPSAMEGCALLAQLVRRSADTCGPVVLVGGGVRPHNIRELMRATAATEFHSACLEWDGLKTED